MKLVSRDILPEIWQSSGRVLAEKIPNTQTDNLVLKIFLQDLRLDFKIVFEPLGDVGAENVSHDGEVPVRPHENRPVSRRCRATEYDVEFVKTGVIFIWGETKFVAIPRELSLWLVVDGQPD